jgi:hypothetical protein
MKKLIFPNPGKKFSSFMQPHVQLPCSRQPVLSQINPVDTFAFCFSKIRFNIILPPRSRSSKRCMSYLEVSHHSPVCVSVLSQISPLDKLALCFSKFRFSIILTSSLGLPSDLLPSDFPTKFLYASFSPPPYVQHASPITLAFTALPECQHVAQYEQK